MHILGMTKTEAASWTRRLAEADGTTEHAARSTLGDWWSAERDAATAILPARPTPNDILRALDSYREERVAAALAYHVHAADEGDE